MPLENPIFSSAFNQIGVEIINHRILPRAAGDTVRPGIFLPGTEAASTGGPAARHGSP